ncbi:MAG: sensor histidine kinase [Candidatus Nanopelagicales bacterium]
MARNPDSRWATSLRARIVAWVLLLLTLILLVTVVTTAGFLWVRADRRITTELLGDAAELRLYAEQGVDPGTGEPFDSPEALLSLHLQNTVPDAHETMFAVVDGQVSARTADSPPIRLDQNPELVARAGAANQTTLGRLRTEAGTVRYVLVPVHTTASDQRGTLVVATFVSAETRQIVNTVLGMVVVATGAILLAAALSWWVAARALAPLAVMRTTARQITEADLSRRIPLRHAPATAPRDELDDLAVTFNDTLDRLERAVLAQRRFVDDAGHELRTPLTIVRGHLELLEDDPAERAATMALVEDELARMSRLVADLLTLTKADDPAFVSLAPCDLATLTEDTLVKASSLGPRRWVLDEAAASASGGSSHSVVRADRQRLTQAMLALADNALRHTREGDEIGIGSRRTQHGGELWVRDTGSGVSPEMATRLFARFSHEPDSPGAGLGLAIVAAIARAHGGRAGVRDTPGGGATFFLLLPLGADSPSQPTGEQATPAVLQGGPTSAFAAVPPAVPGPVPASGESREEGI